MVGHDTMDRVIDAIVHAAANGHPTPMTLLMPGGMVGARLFQMNRDALLISYSDDPVYCEIPPGYKYVRQVGMSEMQLFKSLQNFNYQCAEGDVLDTPLYKEMAAIEEWYQNRLGYNKDPKVHVMFLDPVKQAQYDACEWG
jgi:hypothetical protein